MSFLIFILIFVSTAAALLAVLATWLLVRLYVFQIVVSYRAGTLGARVECGSQSNRLLWASVDNDGWRWTGAVRTRGKTRWQRSWVLSDREIPWREAARRLRSLWDHPKRTEWTDLSFRLLAELAHELALRPVALGLRLSLSEYCYTGYLAAVAHPFNFTLFRLPRTLRLRVIPDFSTREFACEGNLRCTFRGYQLLKPGYHVLSNPEVRRLLGEKLSKTVS